MISPKCKPGDTVIITHNSCFHGFDIGEIVTIGRMTDWDSYFAYDSAGDEWAFDDDDCVAVKGVLQ